MIDNSSIVAESSTALPARNLPLIFLVFVPSSISTVFRIDNVVGDLHITFLNGKIVKVKILLKKSYYCNLIYLISSAHKTFFLLLWQLFQFFWGKALEKSTCCQSHCIVFMLFASLWRNCVQKLICDSPIVQWVLNCSLSLIAV